MDEIFAAGRSATN